MLIKRHRLKSPAAFRRALSTRRLCSSKYFAVYALAFEAEKRPGPEQLHCPTRFGFIVSKKIDKRATRRNRIKRRLREIIRIDLIPQCKGLLRETRAVVVVVRPAILEASYQQIRESLLHCFQ